MGDAVRMLCRIVGFDSPIRLSSMMSPAATSPEGGDDAALSESAADADADAEVSFKGAHKHGGARNNGGYAEKLMCMETHVIRSFLDNERCHCGAKCLQKLSLQGQAAEKTVYDMRAARFASKWCFFFIFLMS